LSDEEYNQLLDRAFEKMPRVVADVSDFKIPAADALIQGNKTIIKNLGIIADRARRKPEEFARYIGKELAVPVSVEDQRLILSGKFSNDDLNKRIQRFFEVYVICKECHKPDSHVEGGGRACSSLYAKRAAQGTE